MASNIMFSPLRRARLSARRGRVPGRSRPDRAVVRCTPISVAARIAKMTVLPDKLIETPDCFWGRTAYGCSEPTSLASLRLTGGVVIDGKLEGRLLRPFGIRARSLRAVSFPFLIRSSVIIMFARARCCCRSRRRRRGVAEDRRGGRFVPRNDPHLLDPTTRAGANLTLPRSCMGLPVEGVFDHVRLAAMVRTRTEVLVRLPGGHPRRAMHSPCCFSHCRSVLEGGPLGESEEEVGRTPRCATSRSATGARRPRSSASLPKSRSSPRRSANMSDNLPSGEGGWLAGLRKCRRWRGRWRLSTNAMPRTWMSKRLRARLGVSRSVLADRFVDILGEPPMRYCTRWRLRPRPTCGRNRRQHRHCRLCSRVQQRGRVQPGVQARIWRAARGMAPPSRPSARPRRRGSTHRRCRSEESVPPTTEPAWPGRRSAMALR